MTKRPNDRRREELAESPLSAGWRSRTEERAVLVGVGAEADSSSMAELAALARTAGAEPVGQVLQPRADPDAATYLGKGKIDDLHGELHASHAQLVVFDAELSPGQLRTLEGRLGVKVIDRTALILDIFALHARSREGKTQVELAQLNYLLPRLRGWGEAMSRLGGGIGTRGPGETKLEVDRQHIHRRITKLRHDIEDMARTRDTKRASRARSLVPQVALAGYTNSGKSTLMNALTGAGVLVADQLFATLDPTTRRLALPNGRTVTLSDTVGFVSSLPHEVVEAFRSTLEEVVTASLVLHVADASSSRLDQQLTAVRGVLAEIGAGSVPEVLVLNKSDLVRDDELEALRRRFRSAQTVSSVSGDGLADLLQRIQDEVPPPPVQVSLIVPFGREDLVAAVYRDGEVLSRRETEEGTFLRARVHERLYARLREFEPGAADSGHAT